MRPPNPRIMKKHTPPTSEEFKRFSRSIDLLYAKAAATAVGAIVVVVILIEMASK